MIAIALRHKGVGLILTLDDVAMPVLTGETLYVSTNGRVVLQQRRSVGLPKRYLSRILTGARAGDMVDHANGNLMDHRMCNLRVCSRQQNGMNMRIQRDTITGFKGVCYMPRPGNYQAYIKITGKKKHLGCFDTANEAAEAYDVAARGIFGEFACVNFPAGDERGCRQAKRKAMA